MKKEILIGVIAVLVFILILQAAYIVSLKRGDNFKQVMMASHRAKAMQQMPDPFEQMQNMQRKMQRALENENNVVSMRLQPVRLNVNLSETVKEYIITADMPGMKKEDISIELKGNFITISGERKSEQNVQKDNFSLQEVSAGKIYRTLALPKNIKKKEITSEYSNGVLSIVIPKETPVKQEETLDIKVPVK